ncbi:MAG: sigma-70 family RNA polymerase sigma factor [Bacteroidia bacterium]|nr:sigma-70 family RNA polymerase sigma factor [Bacteroidia bacterium]
MSKSDSQNAQELLVTRLMARDVEAFREFYENYSDAIFGVISKILRDSELAEDTLQDVFLKCWRKIDSYDRSKGTIFTWLLNIARNAAIDKLRSKEVKYKGKFGEMAEDVRTYSHLKTEMPIDQIGLNVFLQMLPPEQLQIIEYVYFNGYTHVEVSEELGLPLGTIKSRIRIALRELRSYMSV